MTGLYVQLDVDYFTDDEFIEAGPLAEVLYIRSLCFAKRKMTDGVITSAQLATIGFGIPNLKKHVTALERVGLWTIDDGCWTIKGYLKRNQSKQEIESVKALAREAGEAGNHERWHRPPDGKQSPKCRLCRANWIGSPIAPPMGVTKRVGSPDTETQEETDTDTKSSSSTRSGGSTTQVGPFDKPEPDDDEKRVTLAIARYANLVAADKHNPGAYAHTITKNALSDGLRDQMTLGAKLHPTFDADQLADWQISAVNGHSTRATVPAWTADVDCQVCDGTGYEPDDDNRTVHPCPCRTNPKASLHAN
jgi:hypothetical protein